MESARCCALVVSRRGKTGRISLPHREFGPGLEKLHSLFGRGSTKSLTTWPSYVHSLDDDPAAANAIAGGDSDNWTSRYKRVYFVPIVRSKMATDVAGRRSKKTYVSLEAIGPGTFKVKDGLKACKFRWDEEAWHYDRDTDDRARKSFSQTARDLRAQFEIHRDGIPVRLKPASMRQTRCTNAAWDARGRDRRQPSPVSRARGRG